MRKFFSKRWVKNTGKVILVLIIISAFASGGSQEEVDKLTDKVKEKEKKIVELESENKKLQEKVETAKPFFELEEAERLKKEEEVKAQKAEEEKKRKAEEEEERKKQEEEEKKGYDTGITYDQLARTPDDFVGKKVKFSGKVLQVMEGKGETQVRLAVDSNYDTVLLAAYTDGTTNERILKDDTITIRGVSTGLMTYESTMGGEITIPAVLVDKIE